MDWIQDAFNWIKAQLQKFLDFFLEIFQKLWELVCKVGSYIFDFFFHEEKGLVWWLCDYLISLARDAVTWFPDLNAVLQQYQAEAGTFQTVIGRMNQFFPITESLALVVTFMGVFLAVLCWRWLVKLFRGA